MSFLQLGKGIAARSNVALNQIERGVAQGNTSPSWRHWGESSLPCTDPQEREYQKHRNLVGREKKKSPSAPVVRSRLEKKARGERRPWKWRQMLDFQRPQSVERVRIPSEHCMDSIGCILAFDFFFFFKSHLISVCAFSSCPSWIMILIQSRYIPSQSF